MFTGGEKSSSKAADKLGGLGYQWLREESFRVGGGELWKRAEDVIHLEGSERIAPENFED